MCYYVEKGGTKLWQKTRKLILKNKEKYLHSKRKTKSYPRNQKRSEVIKIIDFFNEISLSEILLYFVSGFIFTRTFIFSRLNNPKTDYQSIVLTSLIPGYILSQTYKSFVTSGGNHFTVVAFITLCAVTGYVSAKIYSSKTFQRLLEMFGINRTTNDGIWNDILDGGRPMWIRATIKEQDEDVYGELTYAEIGVRHPILVLGRYEICKLNGELVKNLEDDPARFYVLDTEKCDRLELVYSDIAEDEDDTEGEV